MAYGKISQFGIRRTNQYGSSYDKKTSFKRRSSCCSNGTIWSIQETSIQIYSRSSKDKTRITDTRGKNSIYSQTSDKFGLFYQRACKLYGRIDKRYSNRCPEILFKEKGVWLRGVAIGMLKWLIVLIGWQILRFHRYISYWFQRRSRIAEKIIQV